MPVDEIFRCDECGDVLVDPATVPLTHQDCLGEYHRYVRAATTRNARKQGTASERSGGSP